MTVKTIILAAGQGTRMRSRMPKVLHTIADKPLLQHVYDTASEIADNSLCIVYGHGGEQVKTVCADMAADWVEQKQRLGTGHAVQQALGFIEPADRVLILYGDVPLLQAATLKGLLSQLEQNSVALLTVNLADPHGYGRIIRDENGSVRKIVEQKDATESELLVNEGNTGIMAVMGADIIRWLGLLGNNNAQGEYYLTDIIEMAVNEGFAIRTCQPKTESEVLGVNDRAQLAYLERTYQREQANKLMRAGVTLRDPERVDVRGRFERLGEDIVVDVNVIFTGRNSIGSDVSIGANCIISDSVIEEGAVILANTIVEEAIVGPGSRVGPYARLRPQAKLAEHVHIGNFVEIKKSFVAQGSKINHLSYIGDSEIGSRVNVGAGTITCNYDGVNKHRTVIKDGAFIGSNTQLVAPVTVGSDATIGAGSTITDDTPDGQLTLARAKQVSISGWQRPDKRKS